MLTRGDRVPHFAVTDVHGRPIAYRDIWQHRNLVLIALPSTPSGPPDDAAYARALDGRFEDDTVGVITRNDIAGLPPPGALVADKWGEIFAVWTGAAVSDLPSAQELADWVAHVRHACPECEGETR
jgi:hypothetical protein